MDDICSPPTRYLATRHSPFTAMKQDVNPVSPSAPDAVAVALAVVLCLSWGVNQVAVKLALLSEIPPLDPGRLPPSTFAGPHGGGAVALAAARQKLMEADGTLTPGIVAGVLFGLEFLAFRIYRGLALGPAPAALRCFFTPRRSSSSSARAGFCPAIADEVTAMGGAAAVVRRHRGRLRRADAGRR